MLDLGTSFLASVERNPDATAIVDRHIRLTYGAWYAKISSLVAAFDDLGLELIISLPFCKIAGKPPRSTGRGNSLESSSRR